MVGKIASTYSGSLCLWGLNKGIVQQDGDTAFFRTWFASRSCIFVRSTIYAFPLLELSIGDMMTEHDMYWRKELKGMCFSTLDVMLLHTRVYGGAWTSIYKENVQWNLISTKHNRCRAHLL